ncbi:uncharacterized protein DDB_G0287625-like [Hyposmocoma kahamanoa]|uniref:uncharacterized protein DDB_G0287625-like n=1 Tax=Hyposmocoma kahamanoa TaxID=1477025 RepID=UPI000E6D797E|nr:uncharacterized protein DDB_G0287625-like [Hyposmocoma kahamanoa]
MAQLQLFDLALKIVPEYNGDANSLYRFINASDHIFTQYFDNENENNFQNIIIVNGLIGKLKGKALDIVDVNAANTWPRIKEVLIENFSDQRDENSLNRDLVNLHQGNESPQQFYDKCTNLLTTLINYINLHNDDQNVIACKRDFFTAQALKSFLAGLREPLGSTIRAMRPESLPQALQFIKEEGNIMYLQKRNQPQSNTNINKQANQNYKQNPNFYQNPNFRQNNSQRFSPNWFQQRPNQNHNNNNLNQQNFRSNFNQPRPNQNLPNKFNYFYQDPNFTPRSKPTPMSGISHPNTQNNNNHNYRFVQKPNFRLQQPNAQRPNYFQNVGHYPDFVFEELNHNDTNNNEFVDQSCFADYSNDYDIEPEFIPVPHDTTSQVDSVPTYTQISENCDNQNFHDVLNQNNET